MFALWQNGFSVQATGSHRRLTPTTVREVEQHVRAWASAVGHDTGHDTGRASGQCRCGAPGLIVGALPFAPDAAPLLYQPSQVEWGEGSAMPRGMAARLRPVHAGWQVLAMAPRPTEEGYAATVRAALSRMADTRLPALHKVVLARTLELELSQAIDPLALTRRLAADPAVATFLIDLSAWSGVADHSFLGATPELLVSRRGRRVVSHPLAGSAARLPDAAADRAAGEGLLGSDKDRREHRMVVEDILDRLAPYCSQLSTPEGTALRSTRTMWHLGTRIEGRLKSADMPSAAGLAALLHPTPAVGGYPREAALEAIRELEGQDRGFYAGAIGWAEGSGDGDWYVALRCAEIRSRRVLLHAGAGIVAGSDAEAEVEETSAKFRAMLVALGVGEEEELKELAS